MSRIVRDHINNLLQEGIRQDGRKTDEYRDITVEYGISEKSAEGSARVKIGDTEVVAGVKFGVGDPFPDKQDEGTIMVGAELSPLASPKFESGPPSIDSIEISRVVDRGIRESGALDFKKLCITKGEKVWLVFIDIYPINDGGNIRDAASLAALAAMENARFPEYDKKTERVNYDKRTNTKLPLTDRPIEVTTIKIGDHYIVDPTVNEESVLDARLTVASLNDGTICALQKGGEGQLSIEDVDAMVELSLKHAKTLRKTLK